MQVFPGSDGDVRHHLRQLRGRGVRDASSLEGRHNRPLDVTATPAVQRDLAFAFMFWTVEQPQLVASCSPERVTLAPLAPGLGNDGQPLPPAQASAETALAVLNDHIQPCGHHCIGRWLHAKDDALGLCALVTHEVAHTLGLDDTANGNGVLDGSSGRWDQPLRDQAVWGMRHMLRKDRVWLAAHHLTGPPVAVALRDEEQFDAAAITRGCRTKPFAGTCATPAVTAAQDAGRCCAEQSALRASPHIRHFRTHP